MGALKTNTIKLFILDEADKLVDSDMKADIDFILKKLPVTKQVIASSATYSNNTFKYFNKVMSSPTLLEPDTDTPLLLGLKQFVSVVKSNLNVVHQLNIKNEELNKLLSQISFSQCLVFTNYLCRAESISNTLNRKGWNSLYISAAQSQAERFKVINLFKEGQCRILLSTDVTARGIDAANIDLVINYDVPFEASTYLHRMGRAGRFGSQGVCITIAANGKDLTAYRAIIGEIGGINICVPQLPKEGNLPNDLWNIDTSSYELIQGICGDDNKLTHRDDIVSSIANLKAQRRSFKQKDDVKNTETKGLIDEVNKTETLVNKELDMLDHNVDSDMSQTVDLLIEANKKKQEDFKSKIATQNALSLLKSLASGEDLAECEISQESLDDSKQSLLGDILDDISNSKKRKRASEITNIEDRKDNSNQIMCKNLVLLNATKLLCESYGTNNIPEEVSSIFHNYSATPNENEFKEMITSSDKKDILNRIVEGEVENISNSFTPVDDEGILEIEKSCDGNLEDIFKLSYDYAINSENTHWLNALGEELTEKMSLTDEVASNQCGINEEEVPVSLLELPKRRKHRSNKKRTFKDFTQKSRKCKDDYYNQPNESYASQEMKSVENQVNLNCYQTELYPNYAHVEDEHYTSCFNYYSNMLTQSLQTFEDVESFNTWFTDWQWQVRGVRDYVQQNIYIQEMNKCTRNNHI